jgi:hypothetical protein
MILKKAALSAALILTLSTILSATDVLACSCMPADDPKAQEKAMDSFDLIATVEILDIAVPSNAEEPQTYYVRMLTAHKGKPLAQEFEVKDSSASSCGNYFARGSTQLVGIDREFGRGYTLHGQCDQLLLDGYMAGERDLNNGGATIPPIENY